VPAGSSAPVSRTLASRRSGSGRGARGRSFAPAGRTPAAGRSRRRAPAAGFAAPRPACLSTSPAGRRSAARAVGRNRGRPARRPAPTSGARLRPRAKRATPRADRGSPRRANPGEAARRAGARPATRAAGGSIDPTTELRPPTPAARPCPPTQRPAPRGNRAPPAGASAANAATLRFRRRPRAGTPSAGGVARRGPLDGLRLGVVRPHPRCRRGRRLPRRGLRGGGRERNPYAQQGRDCHRTGQMRTCNDRHQSPNRQRDERTLCALASGVEGSRGNLREERDI
jgi:hypothetical protein